MKELISIFSDVIHQVQKERGATSLYLGSKGSFFKEEIEQQFASVDNIVERLRAACYENVKQKSAFSKLENVLESLDQLEVTRQSIREFAFSPSKAIDFYTHKIITPLLDVISEVMVFDEKNDPSKVSAYVNFLQWKERIGLERAIGMEGFVNHTFDKEFIEHIHFLVAEQQAFERMFMSLATSDQKKMLEGSLKEGNAYSDVEHIHQMLLGGNKAPLENIDAPKWFNTITAKVELLKRIEDQLADNLRRKESDLEGESPSVSQDTSLNTTVKHYKEFISNLPLFSGVSDSGLDMLLEHAQIRDYPKGTVLFLAGEQATRLHIILHGWVKLFKGTDSGNESILQVLSSGDTFMESVAFLNATYPVSAQVVEDAKLLTIPASILRERLRENNELAINMLTSMSYRSQSLMQQIERLTLKTASQRVGWFLLKLFLDNKRRKTSVTLPYDKLLIASYLDMKPETFSRILKELRKEGITVEGSNVTLEDMVTLCQYCDLDTSRLCEKHGTKECTNYEEELVF